MTENIEGILLSVGFTICLLILLAILISAGREDRAVDEAEAKRRAGLSNESDELLRLVHAAKVELRKRGHVFGWVARMHPLDVEVMTSAWTYEFPQHRRTGGVRIWGMDVIPTSYVQRGTVLLFNELGYERLSYDGETLR